MRAIQGLYLLGRVLLPSRMLGQETVGGDSPTLLEFLLEHGQTYVDRGEYRAAATVFKQALSICARHYCDSETLVKMLSGLAFSTKMVGDFETAEVAYGVLVKQIATNSQLGSVDSARVYFNYGQLRRSLGDPVRGIGLLQKAEDSLAPVKDEEPLIWCGIEVELARLEQETADLDAATRRIIRLVEFMKLMDRGDESLTTKICIHAAAVCVECKQLDFAHQVFDAYQPYIRRDGVADDHLTFACAYLARILLLEENVDAAQWMIDILKKKDVSKSDPDVQIAVHVALASYYEAQQEVLSELSERSLAAQVRLARIKR